MSVKAHGRTCDREGRGAGRGGSIALRSVLLVAALVTAACVGWDPRLARAEDEEGAVDAPLRIAARCLGEFDVSHIELTDGLATRRHQPFRQRHRLGTPAPTAGWPRIDWQTNTDSLALFPRPDDTSAPPPPGRSSEAPA